MIKRWKTRAVKKPKMQLKSSVEVESLPKSNSAFQPEQKIVNF